MTRKEFEEIVNDAVANGADRKEAEAFVRAGFKIDEDAEGQEKLGSTAAAPKAPAKKAAAKKKAK